MTSIHDVSYEDIKIFLDANGETFENKDDAYDKALNLLSKKNIKGHTTSIIEWIMAHNLLINKVNIPYYTIYEIDNMSQDDINDLAKLLKMKGNKRENIKNILRYLHKLQNEDEFLIKDINKSILDTLTQLELQDIDVSKLKYNDVIDLLKTHRNKKVIRKFIYDNLEKIIIYNSLYLDFEDIQNDPLEYFLDTVTIYNKDIMIELIKDNKKYYNDVDINDIIKQVKEINNDENGEVYIGKSEMYDLVDFTLNLIDINEIILANKVFDIANELHYFGRSYPYNYNLVDFSLRKEPNVLKTVIDFMGEEEFAENYELIYSEFSTNSAPDKNLLENLLKLERYELLEKIIQIYIGSRLALDPDRLLQKLQKIKITIKSKNDDLILKYIKNI